MVASKEGKQRVVNVGGVEALVPLLYAPGSGCPVDLGSLYVMKALLNLSTTPSYQVRNQ